MAAYRRACDWKLDAAVPHVRIPKQLDRETDDDGRQKRRKPKHDSVRTVEIVQWLLPTMRDLKRLAIEAGGPTAPIWPALSDPTKHVRHDAFSKSYFHPQAIEAHRRMVEMAKDDPSIRVCWSHEEVPQWQEPGVPKLNNRGEQITRRKFEHTSKSLRHYFATWCLAPVSDGGLDAPTKTVQRWMGHSSPQVTTEMYLSHEPGEVQRLLARAQHDERGTDGPGRPPEQSPGDR